MKTSTEMARATLSMAMFCTPVSSETTGAYSTMIVTVFRLVVMKFCSWFPPARAPQTRTIAVQGLEPRRMRETMSWSCPARSRFASITVTRGEITQLENRVSAIGLGLLASFLSSSSRRFRRAGYIIRNRQMPMGMEMPPTCQLSMARLRPGRYWESIRPIAMHSATQAARYFSKDPRRISVADIRAFWSGEI